MKRKRCENCIFWQCLNEIPPNQWPKLMDNQHYDLKIINHFGVCSVDETLTYDRYPITGANFVCNKWEKPPSANEVLGILKEE